MIDAKTFVFEAQKVTPQGGRLIILNDYSYFLKFNSDTVSCDLPFLDVLLMWDTMVMAELNLKVNRKILRSGKIEKH